MPQILKCAGHGCRAQMLKSGTRVLALAGIATAVESILDREVGIADLTDEQVRSFALCSRCARERERRQDVRLHPLPAALRYLGQIQERAAAARARAEAQARRERELAESRAHVERQRRTATLGDLAKLGATTRETAEARKEITQLVRRAHRLTQAVVNKARTAQALAHTTAN